jgi:hypothetical protein
MPPSWLTVVAWVSLSLALVTAGIIVYDIYGRGYRQKMGVMEVVWPVTALYFGPPAWLAYRRWGRANSARRRRERAARPRYGETVSVAVAVSHCGAGCTLGDIIGAWVVFAIGWKPLGLALPGEYVADYSFAYALGIAFQYFSIAPMRGLGVRDGILAAVRADTLSLSAFEVGLFGWMAIIQLVLFTRPHLAPDHAAYWFFMQVGMTLGFVTAYPVNSWLVRRGIKESM